MSEKTFAVGDRVKRNNNSGPMGTVKEIRVEVTATSQDAAARGKMYVVLWDNGTLSCFGAEGLVKA